MKEILMANKYKNPIPIVQEKVTNVSADCKDLLSQMLEPEPE